ncbi:MAG: hypothetical protein ACTSR3_22305 [Candidatus Helarchaeota archaeon]
MKESEKNNEKIDKNITPDLFKNLAFNGYYDQFEDPNFFQIIPERYLISAEKNLSEKTSFGDIDSVMNSKKAVHCQIDKILWNLGFSLKKNRFFLQKLQKLRDCGVIAPEILVRLNNTRNLLEHKYYFVKRSDAQELYDIAKLFIKASSELFSRVEFINPKYFLKNKSEFPCGEIFINRKKKMIVIRYKFSYGEKLKILEKNVHIRNYDEYTKWIKILMNAK